MDNKFYNNREFQKLNAKWAKKLEDSGFDDLEKNANEYSNLPRSFDERVNNYKTLESTLEYFARASDYLHNGEFKSTKEREIWEHHCDGDTLGEIAAKMKLTRSPIAYHVWNVQKRINLKKSK